MDNEPLCQQGTTTNRISPLLVSFLILLAGSRVFAHPGSGIVAGRQGNLYFVDTGSGIWRVDTNGKLTRLTGPTYHLLAIDLNGRLAKVTLPYFSAGEASVTRVGTIRPSFSPAIFRSLADLTAACTTHGSM